MKYSVHHALIAAACVAMPCLTLAASIEAPPTLVAEWPTTQNRQPLALACSPTPGVLAVDDAPGIEERSPMGSMIRGYLAVMPITTVAGRLSDIAVAPDGHVFAVGVTYSSTSDRLWEFAPGSSTPIRSSEIVGMPSLSAVTVLNDSTLLLAGGPRQYWGGVIFECARNGAVRRQWGPTLGIYPLDIAASASGIVAVSQPSEQKVFVFSHEGAPLGSWGSTGTGEGQFFGPTQKIATDQSGNIFVADRGNNRVQKFTWDGQLLCQWGASGSPAGPLLFGPEAIAADSEGRVFVSSDSPSTGQRMIKVFQTAATSATRRTWGAVKSR